MWGGEGIHTLLRLSNRRVYSSRISCSSGVKRGDEDLDGLLGLLVDIVGSDWGDCDEVRTFKGSCWGLVGEVRSVACGFKTVARSGLRVFCCVLE